jgi:hypothetical protein
MAVPAQVVDHFTDQHWRLNNLYWITDKEGTRVRFELNWAQANLLDELHFLNVVLKARQLGFTTFIQIYMLDICVFHPDTRAGVIAHTKDDAEAIFRDKIKFPYDNLPDAIKRANPVLRDNTTTLELNNNSIIRVGTSLRGGTLQYLHVSEFGKICAKYPEKAREIVTGALNTIEAGQVAFIESTAEGQEGRFYELCQMAQSQQRIGGALTPLDWKFHFYPWWREPSYEIDPKGVIISPELEKYFRKIEPFVRAAGYELTARKRAWYAKKLEMQREDMKREFPSTADEAFEAAVEGAYYADQIAVAELQGRIGEFPAAPNVLVHTVQDIGVGDDNTIWFFQIFPRKVRLVGCYSNNGEGMPHYVTQIRKMALEKGWRLGKHWLPHDGKVREWGTGLTRAEQFVKELQPVKIVPDHYLDDGINAAREVFGICEFDAEACSEGLRALRNYRKEWDEERAIWKDRPRHDWASHYGDGFRYMAMAYREEIPPPEPAKTVEPKGVADMTFDQLLKAQKPKRERI